MSAHVTEWGLAHCAGLLLPPGRSRTFGAINARMRRRNLLRDVVACDGSYSAGRYSHPTRLQFRNGGTGDVVAMLDTPNKIPTCHTCSMLREQALEGRMPTRAQMGYAPNFVAPISKAEGKS